MTRTRSLGMLLLIVAMGTLAFWAVLHQISSVWLDVALRPEVKRALERSLDDQKRLRAHDPANREQYRARFEETRRLLNRIEVLRMNREAMLRRFELALSTVFVVAAIVAAIFVWLRSRRAQLRERGEYLARVTSLQESARRHAHEIKGPLAAARLELDRLGETRDDAERARVQESVAEELERIARFTREFSSFAATATPVLRRESLGQIIEEFANTFATAWKLRLVAADGDAIVCVDRDMLRQVLVNLCTNSAHAGATQVTLSITRTPRIMLDVRDDGGGVPRSLRPRIFDPYVTTRRIGEGMGLGLSISRKILLDHGGDLELAETSEKGTVMRIVFGDATCS